MIPRFETKLLKIAKKWRDRALMDGSWVLAAESIGDSDAPIDTGTWEGGYRELHPCIDNEN